MLLSFVLFRSLYPVLWALGSGPSPQDPSYDTIRLEPRRAVDDVAVRDVDGDSRPDLIVQTARDLRLHRQRETGSFPAEPDQILRLSAETFLWNAVRDGIVTATSRGLRLHPWRDGVWRDAEDLVIHPNLFESSSSDRRAPLRIEFTPDFDADGREEILLFQREEVWLFRRKDPPGIRLVQKLPLPVDLVTLLLPGPHQKMSETATVPQLSFSDFNGDGKSDLAWYRDEAFGVYHQKPDGTFDLGGRYDLATKKAKSRNRYLKFEVPPKVADFNRDGAADLALATPSKGRVHLYYSRPGRTDFKMPDHVVKISDGWSVAIQALDLNDDGGADLVMAGIRKLDLLSGIQAFLSKTVDLELHYFLARPDGTLPSEPDQLLTFTIPFSFEATRESASLDLVFRPDFEGDYNADGILDLLVAEDGNSLAVYPGDRNRGVLSEPAFRIAFAPPPDTLRTEPVVRDLNGDGRSDLILRHGTAEPEHALLELKISRP